MQALIDFDGWRKWKDNAVQNGLKDASNPRQGSIKRFTKPEKLVEKASTLSTSTLVGTDSASKDAIVVPPRLTKEDSEDTVKA
jgi:hypothetical protein